jgi:predicted nucleic acid-binding protein
MHIIELYNSTKIELLPILNNFKWGFTEQIRTELIHYEINQDLDLNSAYIFPITVNELQIFQKKYPYMMEFDIADQTILLAAQREKEPLLTDDSPLFIEAKSLGLESYRLPHFLIYLSQKGFISKKVIRQIIRDWEQRKCYKLQELKRWKREIDFGKDNL